MSSTHMANLELELSVLHNKSANSSRSPTVVGLMVAHSSVDCHVWWFGELFVYFMHTNYLLCCSLFLSTGPIC